MSEPTMIVYKYPWNPAQERPTTLYRALTEVPRGADEIANRVDRLAEAVAGLFELIDDRREQLGISSADLLHAARLWDYDVLEGEPNT